MTNSVRLSSAVTEIGSLHDSEAVTLSRIRNTVTPVDQITPHRFTDNIDRLLQRGGRAWILRHRGQIAGFASVTPTPGLSTLHELDGFISPTLRRIGLASYLLKSLIGALAAGEVRQLYHVIEAADSPAALFLFSQGFYVEHVEHCLACDDLDSLPAAQFDSDYRLRTFARAQAITWFRRLYDAAFAGLPWYQPYESDVEVAADLADARDLLFLDHARRSIGFLWLRWHDLDVAEIEPVGLLPDFQGQGLGRQLMLAGLKQAAMQGGRRVKVGLWSENRAALRLYKHLGFREMGSRLFMAYDLGS